MKKLNLVALLSASMMLSGSTTFANGTSVPETVAEGVEISGNVTIVTGYQHDDKDARGNNLGGMGDVSFATGADNDQFRFVVDQVEIDLAKSFGENIRLRADIDFTDFADTNTRVGDQIDLEQGYVTTNIAIGNGMEFLIGKFNAPVGIESADRNENWLISYSANYRWLVPTQVTGAKLYYAFSDLVDWHFAVVNDLNANGFGDSAIPSVLTRLGFNWGEEGNESTLGIGGGFGPEADTAVFGGASHNAHIDFYGDLDFILALSDTVNLGGEATYRQSNSTTGVGANQKAIAAQMLLNWEVSDVWDLTFRYSYLWDMNPPRARLGSGASTTGGNWNGSFEGSLHSGTVGAGYQIADGAKMKLEYRFDFAAVSGPTFNSDYHSLLAEFAYSF